MDNNNIGFMDTSKWGVQPVPSPDPTGGKHHLWLMYGKDQELLFVTKNANQQSLVDQEWFQLVTDIKVQHYSSREDLSQAKVAAITNGSPKWNSRVTG